MHDNLIQEVEAAIKKTKEWATVGWTTTFGTRKTEVNNLAAARELPDTFVYRLEAIAYWERVEKTIPETVSWGEKALAALKAGDLKGADDAASFAMWVEKPIREMAPTWEPAVNAIRAALKKAA